MLRRLLLLSLLLPLLQLPATAQNKIDYSKLKIDSPFSQAWQKATGDGGVFEPQGPVLMPEQIRDLAAKSSAFISVGGGMATGWFVAPAWLVTNHHVIAGGIKGYVEVYGDIPCTVGRIVADDPEHDLAILEIQYANPKQAFRPAPQGNINEIGKLKSQIQSAMDDAKQAAAQLPPAATNTEVRLADDIPALHLANPHRDLHEGSTVYEYGNPRGYKGTFTTGLVSAYRDGLELRGKFHIEDQARKEGQPGSVPIDAKRGDVIQYSTATSHGSSGSALLNDRGAVIGVCFALDPEGNDLNFATSAKHVRELLEKARGH